MARATDEQVQQYSQDHVRPRSEHARNLLRNIDTDLAQIADVYEHVSGANSIPPTWTDTHTSNPPHLGTPNDILAWNTAMTALQKLRDGTFASVEEANSMFKDQWPVVQLLCVQQ